MEKACKEGNEGLSGLLGAQREGYGSDGLYALELEGGLFDLLGKQLQGV